MNLKCKINGKEYPLAQGATFNEEYNETLDSGTIIIPHIPKIEDLEPYDDVFIYDNESKGYGWEKLDYKKDNVLIFDKDQGGQLAIVARIPNLFVQSLYGEHKLLNSEIKLIFFQEEEPGFFVTTYSACHIYKEGDLYYFYIDELNFREELILDENSDCWVFKRDDDIWIYNYTDIKVDKFEANIIYDYNKQQNKFYKHLLVDNINREELNLDEAIYKYTISLFSETKGLEIVQLPNFSITEPLDIDLKKSIYDYMVDIVDMYSPIYKVVDNKDENTWIYKKKYIVDPDLKDIFSNVYSPDFTLTNPNLRDVLSKLMIVKDMIPYVEDGVIKAKDITQRTDVFKEDKGDYEHINYVYSNKTSSNYCNSLKTTYSDALSQDNSCRMTEYLSFRNSDSALLTFENLKIETTYPIYKINKMHMCYYKRMVIIESNSIKGDEKYFLCKQDITPLVKLSSERNVLSEDWTVFNNLNISSIEDLAKFKMSTIGYDIGSKSISGWGQKFTTYALYSWFPQANSYIEKLHTFMDEFYPYGIYNYSYLREKAGLKASEHIEIYPSVLVSFVSPFSNEYPAGLKGLFFEIEYDAFYNGTIYHSKDNITRDDITINDNPSSSLTILELDGIAQKEKINRFGNDTFQINARYTDISQLKPLGTVYNSKHKADTDVIIYSKEYSIYDKVINCRYIGAKDYVLKNYFTSVYAKHRPYTLMSYNESVYRSENKKIYLLFDTNEKYIEKTDDTLSFKRFNNEKDYQISFSYIRKILSFIKQNIILQKNLFSNPDKINYGFFEHNGNKYASDVNAFISGNSLCFNLKMHDNVGAGVYIDVKNLEPFNRFGDFLEVEDDFKGSLQSWYMTVDNQKTGFVEKMGFYVCHVEKDETIKLIVDDKDEIIGKDTEKVTLPKYFDSVPEDSKKIDVLKEGTIYRKIFEFPKISVEESKIKNLIGNEFLVKKDNKELIDMTFQIEPITKSNKILFSPWMMKLSDLKGDYEKIYNEFSISDDNNFYPEGQDNPNVDKGYELKTIQAVRQVRQKDGNYVNYPIMILELEQNTLDNMELFFENNKNKSIETSVNFSYSEKKDQTNISNKTYEVNILELNFNQVTSYNIDASSGEESLTLNGEESIEFVTKKLFSSVITDANEKVAFKFIKTPSVKCDYIIQGSGGGHYLEDSFYLEPEGGKIWFVFDGYEQDVFIPNKKESYSVRYFLENKEYKEIIKEPTVLNEDNATFNSTYLALSKNLSYIQNMFIVASQLPMEHYKIYDKYKSIEEIGLTEDNLGPIISDVFYFDDENDLIVDLSGFDAEKTKSIQLWYKQSNSKPYQENGEDVNGTLNFVFGVNVDEKDFEKGKLDIHISMLTHRDMRVFDNLHNVVGEVKNVADISEDSEEYTDKFKQKYVEKTE